MSALLEVTALSKTFEIREGMSTKKLNAVRDVSFEIARGEALALVGQSGSGKSTVARILCGLEQASSGTVLLGGKRVLTGRRVPRSYRRQVQMIFQDPFGSLNPVHSIGHHVIRPLQLHKRASRASARDAAVALLERVGLSADFVDKYPHQASGGQLQRVAIARALAVEPELILADEPTSMLDVSLRVGILNLLRELKSERGIAFLYITHDLASARYFAERTLVMHSGQIVERGSSHDLMDEPSHEYTKTLLAAVPDPRRRITT